MIQAVIYEDVVPIPGCGGLNALSPLADLRASFDIRTGALTTLQRLRRGLGLDVVALLPRAEVHGVCAESRDDANRAALVNAVLNPDRSVLFINGRCVLPMPEIGALAEGEMLVEAATGHVIAACGPGSLASELCLGQAPRLREKRASTHALLSRPWHFKAFRDRAIAMDLELFGDGAGALPSVAPPAGVVAFGGAKLTIHPTAKIYPNVTFDLEHGPIAIDEHATVRPGVILIGPLYIGPRTVALDKALIKGNTAVGPQCRIAGELSGTIIQGYSNKGHDGHLGDSWLGEWVNLGAGTTNSNLLNTYGEVISKALPTGTNERTGQQFLGSIIGDHVKTAICSRLMTGVVIHTGAMAAMTAAVSGCVEPFAWYTDSGNRRYRPDKFIEVARAMMGRRKIEPSVAYVERIRTLIDGV